MNNKDAFLTKIEHLIKSGTVEEIQHLFEKEKKRSSKNKFMHLHLTKLKDILSEEKNDKYDLLGVERWKQFDFSINLFEHAVKAKRIDVIDFLIEEKYLRNSCWNFYFNALLESESDFLKQMLQKTNITQHITTDIIQKKSIKCLWNDDEEKWKILLAFNKEALYENIQELMLEAAEHNASKVLLNILNDSSINLDINYGKDKWSFDGHQMRENILIYACENNNQELIKYLFTSKRWKDKIDFLESYDWIMDLPNGKELRCFIILELNVPYTKQIKEKIKQNRDIEMKEMFEKRELKNKLMAKLPENTIKSKTIKI